MLVGIQIVAARGLLSISQNDLAEKTGVSTSTIKKLEKNRHGVRGNVEKIMQLVEKLKEGGVDISNG